MGKLAYPGISGPFQPKRQSIRPTAFNDRLFSRYCKDYFLGIESFKVDGGAASGTTGDSNVLLTGNVAGVQHELFVIGTQTITVPVLETTVGGLDVTQDKTLADGNEIVFGAKHSGVARGRLAFTIGTDKAFFARLSISASDVSGSAPLYFGFKKAIAAGAVSTYTDYAVLGLNDNTGAVFTVTNLNNAGAVATSTGLTWADGERHEIKLVVGYSGAVTYYWDGAIVAAAPAFTFDATDVVVPYFRQEQATDVDDLIVLVGDIANDYCFECGFVPKPGDFAGV